MLHNLIRVILFTGLLLYLSLSSANAQEGGASERDKRQPPVQVIVQIIVTTIALKFFERRIIP